MHNTQQYNDQDAERNELLKNELDSMDSVSEPEMGQIVKRRYLFNRCTVDTIRCFLDIALILCLLSVMLLLFKEMNLLSPQNGHQILRAGSDFNGFVPPDVSSKGIPKPSGPDEFEITAEAFKDMAVMNKTLHSWSTLTHAFVRASPYDGHGPQKPFSGNLFEVAVFHQIHCLTSILEDFVLLSSGVPKEKLPGFSSGVVLTWEEHKAHCFNYVRQALMCFADSTAEGHIEGDEHRVADHGVVHVCNDFTALLDWTKEPERALPKAWKITD